MIRSRNEFLPNCRSEVRGQELNWFAVQIPGLARRLIVSCELFYFRPRDKGYPRSIQPSSPDPFSVFKANVIDKEAAIPRSGIKHLEFTNMQWVKTFWFFKVSQWNTYLVPDAIE